MIQAKTFTYQFKALCIVSSRNFTEGLWKNVPRAAPDPILGRISILLLLSPMG